MEIYMASQPIGAEYARELGLVNQVCPARKTLTAIPWRWRPAWPRGPPSCLRKRVKALFDNSWAATLENQLDAETDAISNIVFTSDFQEGVKAFTQKRMPWFQGR